jgi:protein TonB
MNSAAFVPGVLAPPARRWRHAPAVASVLLAHFAVGWGLIRSDAMRPMVAEGAPLMIEMIAPALPPSPQPAPAPAQSAMPTPKPRKPAPIVAATASPSPEPRVIEAPPPSEQASPPPAVVADNASSAQPTAPPPAVPMPAPAVKTVPSTAVQYLHPPAPVYPALSRRAGETGRTVIRVLIDEHGVPRELVLQQSSGHTRLDESALDAIKPARFKPYTEHGVPQPVWALIPIVFDLEK